MKCHYIWEWLTSKILTTSNASKDVGATGILTHCWWESKIQKTVWQFLTILNILLPYHPAFAFLGIYPNEFKIYIKILYMTVNSSFYSQLLEFGNHQDVELWKLVMDREARRAAIHRVANSRRRLSNWTELKMLNRWID